MFEHWAIPVPNDPGAGIVSNQQPLHEVIRFEAREPRAALARTGNSQSGIGSVGANRAVSKS
jgi:hypothetical protein